MCGIQVLLTKFCLRTFFPITSGIIYFFDMCQNQWVSPLSTIDITDTGKGCTALAIGAVETPPSLILIAVFSVIGFIVLVALLGVAVIFYKRRKRKIMASFGKDYGEKSKGPFDSPAKVSRDAEFSSKSRFSTPQVFPSSDRNESVIAQYVGTNGVQEQFISPHTSSSGSRSAEVLVLDDNEYEEINGSGVRIDLITEEEHSYSIQLRGIPVDLPSDAALVVEHYHPKLDDELACTPGDFVTILSHFDDGWVQGMIYQTDQKGVFPKVCVESIENVKACARKQGYELEDGMFVRMPRNTMSIQTSISQTSNINPFRTLDHINRTSKGGYGSRSSSIIGGYAKPLMTNIPSSIVEPSSPFFAHMTDPFGAQFSLPRPDSNATTIRGNDETPSSPTKTNGSAGPPSYIPVAPPRRAVPVPDEQATFEY